MRNKVVLLSAAFWFCFLEAALAQQGIFVKKITHINPVSYTDVVYTGTRDTVLVATYSGRIARVINGQAREGVFARLDDEVCALAYHKRNKQIISGTLESGILIWDERSRKIIKRLTVTAGWSNHLSLLQGSRYLYAQDQKGFSYLWDAFNEYTVVALPDNFPKGRIVSIDDNDIADVVSATLLTRYDMRKNMSIETINVVAPHYMDRKAGSQYLSIDFNECLLYDTKTGAVVLRLKHPNWPLPNLENEKEIFDIPLSMQLTCARFAGDKIYTAGIDRTLREWNASDGRLLRTLTGHRGTVDKMNISPGQDQLVSVDLKGGIRFWNIQ